MGLVIEQCPVDGHDPPLAYKSALGVVLALQVVALALVLACLRHERLGDSPGSISRPPMCQGPRRAPFR